MVRIDKEAQEYYAQLTAFYQQFRRIGNNYNQCVKVIHTIYGEKKSLAFLYKLAEETRKLEELCKDVRVLRNADRVLPEDDNLLDNQDLCLLFKVSIKTLQRYRAIGALPYFTISGKVYYKASDVREFIKERFSMSLIGPHSAAE